MGFTRSYLDLQDPFHPWFRIEMRCLAICYNPRRADRPARYVLDWIYLCGWISLDILAMLMYA